MGDNWYKHDSFTTRQEKMKFFLLRKKHEWMRRRLTYTFLEVGHKNVRPGRNAVEDSLLKLKFGELLYASIIVILNLRVPKKDGS